MSAQWSSKATPWRALTWWTTRTACAQRKRTCPPQRPRSSSRSRTEARLGKLLKNGWTPQANYDVALRNLRSAEAKLAAARATLDLTRDQLNYTELKADFDGVITSVGAEAGQNVSAGQMVVKLARLTDKDAVFNLAETALVDHRTEGDEVIVWPLSNPQLTIEGVVREVCSGRRFDDAHLHRKGHAERPAIVDPLRHEYRRPLEGQLRPGGCAAAVRSL